MAKRTRQTRHERLAELMTAAAWRLREESTVAETVIIVVGTGGRAGRVLIEWGQSNPSAVYGVLQAAMEQVEMIVEPETVEEEDDDEE